MNTTRTSQPIVGDYRRFDPLRSLDWRWRAAEAHLTAGTLPQQWEDPAIAATLQYIFELARATTASEMAAVQHRYPDLSAAHRIHHGDDALRDELGARLLCQHIQDVSTTTGVALSVVLSYAELFYDVLNGLAAMDWLLGSVVRVYDLHRRGVTEAAQWKYWALAGGPLLLEMLIADIRGLPEPLIPNRHLLAEQFRFLLREFTIPAWDRPAMAAIIKEGCTRFGPLWGCQPIDHRERDVLTNHMRTLRLAYGSSKPRRRRAPPAVAPASEKTINKPTTEFHYDHR